MPALGLNIVRPIHGAFQVRSMAAMQRLPSFAFRRGVGVVSQLPTFSYCLFEPKLAPQSERRRELDHRVLDLNRSIFERQY